MGMTILSVTFAVLLVYYACLHGSYLLLILLGSIGLRRYNRGINFGDFQRISESDLALPFSLIIPAYNEEQVILGTVDAALKLRYLTYEIIVVNDGSADATLAKLVERYRLRRVNKVAQRRLDTRAIRGTYESFEHPNLVVIDKENGSRPDAINAGANIARYPLICVMDADCIYEEDALLRVVRPFLRSSRVVAAGGIVRPANGLRVQDGRIVDTGVPKRMLALIQAVEYLRSFQWARLGLARLRSMLCISGAFMVVRKDIFMAMGGCDATSITDDIDFTVRLHRYLHEHRRGEGLRLEYIPDPVCYTEVPETLRIYASQRNRWQRGTLQALFRQWRMTFNPRYGLAGVFGMPFFLLFEGFSAVVEGLGYVLLPVAWLVGLIDLQGLLVLFALAIVLGTFLSVSAILLQEHTRMRAASMRDLLRLLLAGFVDNLGFHQLHVLFRIAGTFEYIVRRRRDLGSMERYGSYQQAAANGVPPA
jgi:cellulose synthase/poly-beta-1,6-N-acetylglucosamine synthase-like glycosyltransferase